MAARRSLLALLVVATCARAAAASPDERRDRRGHRLIAVGVAAVAYAASETVFKDALAPDVCRWCGVNGFDANVREAFLWSDPGPARVISNVTGFALSPLAGAGLLYLANAGATDDRWGRLIDDVIPMLETVAYSQLINQAVKFAVGRQRPLAHFATEPREADPDDNLSFFSAHSSLTFSIAVSTGVVASRRHYRLAPVVWTVGIGVATVTGYLRIAADKHYASDVLVGAAFGVASGFVIPRLTGSLPGDTTIVPTGRGVAVVGRF